jgi:hypothetical protein
MEILTESSSKIQIQIAKTRKDKAREKAIYIRELVFKGLVLCQILRPTE